MKDTELDIDCLANLRLGQAQWEPQLTSVTAPAAGAVGAAAVDGGGGLRRRVPRPPRPLHPRPRRPPRRRPGHSPRPGSPGPPLLMYGPKKLYKC